MIDFPLDIGCTENGECKFQNSILFMCESCRRDLYLRHEMDKLAKELNIPYLPDQK